MTLKKKHNIFMLIYVVLIALVVLLAVNCSQSKSNVKSAENEIELPMPVYTMSSDTLPFRFDVSDQAVLKVRKNKPGEYFGDLIYPKLNAQLYCTWRQTTLDKISELSEEGRRLAYQHVSMATAIREKQYQNDFARVFARVYDIEGNVATPLQLALTDSANYFFNASLYFNATPNADSIAPYLEYIRNDVMRLIETFTSVSSE